MNPSRRELLIAGTGAALLTGCLGDVTDPNPEDDDPGNDEHCDPIELPRIDTPPHEPTRPEPPDDTEDQDDWDDHFLGEGMDEESPVSFSSVTVRYDPPPIDPVEDTADRILGAELVTDAETLDERIEPVGDDASEALADVDFDEQAVVVIISGFGSSSVRHEWVRVEDNCEELHLHGYYRRPYIQTDDYTVRTSAVIVDRPAEYDLERVWVSLTMTEEDRGNVSTEEDIVDLEDAENGADDEDEDPSGPIEDYEVLGVSRAHRGDWWRDVEDGPGIVVTLPDADAVETVVEMDDDVAQFLDETEFDTDDVYLLEIVGPNACYGQIDVEDLHVIANGGYELEGTARIIDISEGDVECAQVVTFQSILLRAETGVDIEDATYHLIDGWENEARVGAMDFGEFAAE